ncbi:type VI secretion system tube protein Hcp [Pigmentibacter ruber]|uniref:type VI secretion system tube protein Hcp n=1 Tax=Pigmentibacter ruber TaxID=2683196 RepID=UPI00131D5B9E|nr:type VI secretion system tube protein Hcp [Pigmentibacter ruber]
MKFYDRDYYVVHFEGGTLPIKGDFQGKNYEDSVEILEFSKPISDEKQSSPSKPDPEAMVGPIEITLKLDDGASRKKIHNDFIKCVGGNYDHYTKVKVSKICKLNDAYSFKLELELENVKIHGYESGMRHGTFILHFTNGKMTEAEISDQGKHGGNLDSFLIKCTDPPVGSAGV